MYVRTPPAVKDEIDYILNSDHADFGKGGGDPDEGKTDLRLREAHDNDEIDSKYGFDRVRSRYVFEPGLLGAL